MTVDDLALDFIFDARYGELEDVKAYLATGGSHTVVDENGNTALHMSAANGHTDVVLHLLSLSTKEDVNCKNNLGNTPLHWAALNGHFETVKALVEAEADIEAVNEAEHTPVYEAVNRKNDEVAEYLLEKETGDGSGAKFE